MRCSAPGAVRRVGEKVVTNRTMIVARHQSTRDDLAAYLLLLDPDRQVDARFGSASEAIEELAKQPPDLLLLEVDLPDESGLSFTRRVHRTWPGVAIIAFGIGDTENYRRAALDVGAREYIDTLDLVSSLPTLLDNLLAEGTPGARDDPPPVEHPWDDEASSGSYSASTEPTTH